ncbi:MAG: putative toxin-antitoxin system toxin component, PIN family [Burkholderiales bacterium PBB1]|nr:MAG: putative toxin-antitoxin system toxin component, PIN family [Burkholderiales bacterium PBB1]
MKTAPKIVIDTNVLVSALRSRRGQSFALLSLLGSGKFEHVVSVPLVMEYEAVLLRGGMVPLSNVAVQDVIDYLCATGLQQDIHFLWRPQLPDLKDDMVLEAAVNGGCEVIVTHNVRDFAGTQALGVSAMTPAEFMTHLKEHP